MPKRVMRSVVGYKEEFWGKNSLNPDYVFELECGHTKRGLYNPHWVSVITGFKLSSKEHPQKIVCDICSAEAGKCV